MYRELLISVGISCIIGVVLFLYFKNKMGKMEQKVDLMFQLIQEYEQQKNMQVQNSYPTNQMNAAVASNVNAANLIHVSDDDSEDDTDSDEVSDTEEDSLQIGENDSTQIKTINLEGAETNSLEVENEDFIDDLDEISDLEENDDEFEKEEEELEDDNDLDTIELSDSNVDKDIVSITKTIPLKESKALKDCTVKELKKLCQEKGFTNYKALRKQKLIDLLESE